VQGTIEQINKAGEVYRTFPATLDEADVERWIQRQINGYNMEQTRITVDGKHVAGVK
jgi:hypothetical protein